MPAALWRLVEAHLRRRLPPAHASSTIGDLAEDYARRRATTGAVRARIWLLREAHSLDRAYRTQPPAVEPPPRLMLRDDLRHASRRIVANPGSALLCSALLALGIGLSTTMFSVLDAMLIRPVPFSGAGRLVDQSLFPGSSPKAVMEEWHASGLFDAVEAGQATSVSIASSGGVRTYAAEAVTPGLFRMLGVKPIRGRTLTDAQTGTAREIVLVESVWRAEFGADPDSIGRTVRLGELDAVLVGVMPDSFRFPRPTTVVWQPLDPLSISASTFRIYGQLKRGVPVVAAAVMAGRVAETRTRIPDNYRAFPTPPPGLPPELASSRAPLLDLVHGPELDRITTRAIWLLAGGVALVFLVICANVSTLLLTQLSARRREFAMCAALGASRARLIRQALAEHALLAAAGVVFGVALAMGLLAMIPDAFVGRSLNAIDLDPRAIAAASALGLVAVVVSGVLPAWLGTRARVQDSLRASRQAGVETRAARVLARGMLAAQIALACSLLVGSTLLVRSFVNLIGAERGLDSAGVTRVSLDLRGVTRSDAGLLATTAAEIDARFSAYPDVIGVALSHDLPPGSEATAVGAGGQVRLGPPGRVPPGTPQIRTDGFRVSASFFDLYRIPILRGRTFTPGDTELDVIVGDRLAAQLWPGQDPIGRQFAIGSMKGARTVVGVAREIALPTIDPARDRPEFYQPLDFNTTRLYLSLRCSAACPGEEAIRDLARNVHPGINARPVPHWETPYDAELLVPRAIAQVAGVFALVAVVTSAGGLFSVLTYAVSRRRREFGIRTALGASPTQMRRLVFVDGSVVVATGIAIGGLGGWLIGRGLAAFHYGVGVSDPATWAAVIGTIAIASLAAAWRPARQAMRVDPVRLLREE